MQMALQLRPSTAEMHLQRPSPIPPTTSPHGWHRANRLLPAFTMIRLDVLNPRRGGFFELKYCVDYSHRGDSVNDGPAM